MTDRPKRPRRDPRTEREARRASRRRPVETQAEEPRRQRRNPRAERAARKAPSAEATPAARPRVDPRAARAARRDSTPAPETESAGAPVTVVADPTYLVLALPDLENGRLSSHDRDLLGAARALADADGGAVLTAIFEEPRDDLGLAGIDRAVRFDNEATEGYAPEARSAAVVALAEQLKAKHLLFPDRPAPGGDLGRRVAARLDERAATGVWRIDGTQVTRRALGGSHDVTLEDRA